MRTGALESSGGWEDVGFGSVVFGHWVTHVRFLSHLENRALGTMFSVVLIARSRR